MSNSKIDFKSPMFDGLFRKNTVLISGLVVAPIVVAAKTVSLGLALIIAFSTITFLSVLISSFLSRHIVYTIRIILYTIIASLVYVPVIAMMYQIMPIEAEELGIFLPLLITNSLIVSKSEFSFYKKSNKGKMMVELVSYILGFCIVVLAFTFIREILSTGAIGGRAVGIPMNLPVLSLPFGGFILIGLISAIYKKALSLFEGRGEK